MLKLKCFKKLLKLKVYVREKGEVLKTNMMFRIYRRFVFFKNSSIIVGSLLSGDLSTLIYSLGLDLDNYLGRPQTLLQALAKAQEKIEEVNESAESSNGEKTKKFLYEQRGTIVVVLAVTVTAVTVYLLTGGTGTPSSTDTTGVTGGTGTSSSTDMTRVTNPSEGEAATVRADMQQQVPLAISEADSVMDKIGIQAHTDEFSQLQEKVITGTPELPVGLPHIISDINNLDPTKGFSVTTMELPGDMTIAQVLVAENADKVVPYYVLPAPESMLEDAQLQEMAAEALWRVNTELSTKGLPLFEDVTYVALVNPENSRGTLFLEYSSLSNIEGRHVSFKK